MSDSFSYAVIGKAMEVHRALGPGVDEIFYHELLSERLRAAGIEHLFRPRGELIHRGIVADIFEADLVFPVKLVAELKCLKGTFDPEHFLQTICYQNTTRCDCLAIRGRFGVQVLALRRAIGAADIAILRTHLGLLGLQHGLIVNFGKSSLEHCWIRCAADKTQSVEAHKNEN